MLDWNKLSNELKMCVLIYKEQEAGKVVRASRLVELMKDLLPGEEALDCAESFTDLGIIASKHTKIGDDWPECYSIPPESLSFVEDIIEKLSKTEALHNSKGGEKTMTSDETKAEPKSEKTPESMIDAGMRMLKKDHNWKILVGMFVWWLIAKLIYG